MSIRTAAARLGQPRALCTFASGPGTVSKPHKVKWLKLQVAPIKRSWKSPGSESGQQLLPSPRTYHLPLLTKSLSSGSCASSALSSTSLEKFSFPISPSPISSVTITNPANPGGTATSSPLRPRPRNDTCSPAGGTCKAIRPAWSRGNVPAASSADHEAREPRGLPGLTVSIAADGGREEAFYWGGPADQDVARQEVQLCRCGATQGARAQVNTLFPVRRFLPILHLRRLVYSGKSWRVRNAGPVGRPSALDAEPYGNRSLPLAALCKDTPSCGQVFMCDLILRLPLPRAGV